MICLSRLDAMITMAADSHSQWLTYKVVHTVQLTLCPGILRSMLRHALSNCMQNDKQHGCQYWAARYCSMHFGLHASCRTYHPMSDCTQSSASILAVFQQRLSDAKCAGRLRAKWRTPQQNHTRQLLHQAACCTMHCQATWRLSHLPADW